MIAPWRTVVLLFLIAIDVVQPASASSLQRLGFEDLKGWTSDDHAAALQSFRRSCREILDEGLAFQRPTKFGGARSDWIELCNGALAAAPARSYFESYFTPFKVVDDARPEGLFTGYYEPEAEGARTPDAKFTVPIYRRPATLVSFSQEQKDKSGLDYGHLVDGKPAAYFSRKDIEQGALKGQGLELVWLKDWADAFFIHVQGSGRVRFADGSTMRLSYAAKSGRRYTSIGGLLVERGLLTREQMSMQAIRAWMSRNPQETRALMWENQSFIFFREAQLQDPSLGALSAQHVQLTSGRSLAVDRGIWAFGTPVWLETNVPSATDGVAQPFNQLLIAQDTGTAITGHARGDVFWGFGEAAGNIAGRMKSPGSMIVLLPKTVAARLGLIP